MNNIKNILLIACFLAFSATGTQAQIIVKVRPPRPRVVVTRPAPPHPHAVWVEEDWIVDHGQYRWHGGYWAVPPRPRAVWVSGHWRHTRRGDIWIPGH